MNSRVSSLIKQPAFVWTAVCVLLFAVIPWGICFVIRSDAAMAACFLLWYAIDPIVAIAAGMFAGKRPRELWFLPILIPVLFLLASWTCFEWGDPGYLSFAFMYLLLSGTTMFVFLILTNGRRK